MSAPWWPMAEPPAVRPSTKGEFPVEPSELRQETRSPSGFYPSVMIRCSECGLDLGDQFEPGDGLILALDHRPHCAYPEPTDSMEGADRGN